MITLTAATPTIRRVVPVATMAAIVLAMSACGSTTGSEPTTSAGQAGSSPVTAGSSSPEPTTADASTIDVADTEPASTTVDSYPIDEALAAQQFIPASSFDLPCAEYVEASEYPLFPCDKGLLVEDLQRALAQYDGGVEVDGFYGANTVGTVQNLQRSFGLYDTGIADGILLSLIAGVDAVPDEPVGGDEAIVDSGLTASEIADVCAAVINSGAPDISDFEYELCERNGYLPVSGE